MPAGASPDESGEDRVGDGKCGGKILPFQRFLRCCRQEILTGSTPPCSTACGGR